MKYKCHSPVPSNAINGVVLDVVWPLKPLDWQLKKNANALHLGQNVEWCYVVNCTGQTDGCTRPVLIIYGLNYTGHLNSTGYAEYY